MPSAPPSVCGGYYHTGDVAMRTRTAISPTSAATTTSSRPDYDQPVRAGVVLIEHRGRRSRRRAGTVRSASRCPRPTSRCAGARPPRATALSILASRASTSPFKRVRRLEFVELPKTISGKIRRVELKEREEGGEGPGGSEWRDGQFVAAAEAPVG